LAYIDDDAENTVIENKAQLVEYLESGCNMTELNVTSPTGIRDLERASDVRIAEQILDAITSTLQVGTTRGASP